MVTGHQKGPCAALGARRSGPASSIGQGRDRVGERDADVDRGGDEHDHDGGACGEQRVLRRDGRARARALHHGARELHQLHLGGADGPDLCGDRDAEGDVVHSERRERDAGELRCERAERGGREIGTQCCDVWEHRVRGFVPTNNIRKKQPSFSYPQSYEIDP